MRILFIFILILGLTKGNNMNEVIYMEVNNTKIPIIQEISNALPIGFINIIFNGAGNLDEKKTGLSSFSTNMLDRGSKKRGEYGFATELEKRAINLNINNSYENISLSIEFLKEEENKAIALLGELLADPNLTKKALEQTKLILSSYLLSKENDFDYIAKKNLKSILFKGTPLERTKIGTLKDIENINLDDVKDFLSEKLSLNNAVILIGGDLDIENTKKQLTKILKILKNGTKYTSKKYLPNADSKEIIDTKPTKQAYIYFGSPFDFTSYKDELHKAQIMSFIMGASGFGSRIMEEIRVKRGLAYSAYFYNSIDNTSANTFGYLQTKLENKDEAIKAVRETIEDFLKGNVTKQELDDAKSYILGSRVLSDETLSSRLGKKYINFYRNLPLDYDKTLIQKIKDLRLEELNQYIQSHKEIKNLSFSIVVDK